MLMASLTVSARATQIFALKNSFVELYKVYAH